MILIALFVAAEFLSFITQCVGFEKYYAAE
jgi:hypothetical protein